MAFYQEAFIGVQGNVLQQTLSPILDMQDVLQKAYGSIRGLL